MLPRFFRGMEPVVKFIIADDVVVGGWSMTCFFGCKDAYNIISASCKKNARKKLKQYSLTLCI